MLLAIDFEGSQKTISDTTTVFCSYFFGLEKIQTHDLHHLQRFENIPLARLLAEYIFSQSASHLSFISRKKTLTTPPLLPRTRVLLLPSLPPMHNNKAPGTHHADTRQNRPIVIKTDSTNERTAEATRELGGRSSSQQIDHHGFHPGTARRSRRPRQKEPRQRKGNT